MGKILQFEADGRGQRNKIGGEVKVLPQSVEPWPRIGHRVSWLGPDMPAEVATVVEFLEGGSPDCPDEKLWPSHYRIQTTEYAFRKDVECIDDGPLRVGAKVHLIENGEYFNADLNKSNPALAKSLDNVFVVKEICSKCNDEQFGCVELEHSWNTTHKQIAPHHDMFLGCKCCPENHRFRCDHIGHGDDPAYECRPCSHILCKTTGKISECECEDCRRGDGSSTVSDSDDLYDDEDSESDSDFCLECDSD